MLKKFSLAILALTAFASTNIKKNEQSSSDSFVDVIEHPVSSDESIDVLSVVECDKAQSDSSSQEDEIAYNVSSEEPSNEVFMDNEMHQNLVTSLVEVLFRLPFECISSFGLVSRAFQAACFMYCEFLFKWYQRESDIEFKYNHIHRHLLEEYMLIPTIYGMGSEFSITGASVFYDSISTILKFAPSARITLKLDPDIDDEVKIFQEIVKMESFSHVFSLCVSEHDIGSAFEDLVRSNVIQINLEVWDESPNVFFTDRDFDFVKIADGDEEIIGDLLHLARSIRILQLEEDSYTDFALLGLDVLVSSSPLQVDYDNIPVRQLIVTDDFPFENFKPTLLKLDLKKTPTIAVLKDCLSS